MNNKKIAQLLILTVLVIASYTMINNKIKKFKNIGKEEYVQKGIIDMGLIIEINENNIEGLEKEIIVLENEIKVTTKEFEESGLEKRKQELIKKVYFTPKKDEQIQYVAGYVSAINTAQQSILKNMEAREMESITRRREQDIQDEQRRHQESMRMAMDSQKLEMENLTRKLQEIQSQQHER